MPTVDELRGARGLLRLAARFGLPVLGSVLLAVGGLWAVDRTQTAHAGRAFNPGSAGLYALMILGYALAAFAVRAWYRRGEPALERAALAGAEALLVGLVTSPVAFVALTMVFFEPR